MGKKKVFIATGANPFNKSRSAAGNMLAPAAHNIGYVDDAEDVETQPKKKAPRQFPGKQHVHLILPDRQANMIKQLAKISGVSVNQFMSHAVDRMYKEKWKPVVDNLEQNRHKLGFN